MQTLLLLPPGAILPDANEAGPDALVFDLGEAAATTWIETVRDHLAARKDDDTRPLVFVRLAGLDMPGVDAVLAALMPAEPDGFVLGRCAGGRDVQHLGTKLAVHEATLDLPDGQTAILAEIGAVPRCLLTLDSFVDCSRRLLALVWNPQAFAAGFGIEPNDSDTGPAATARNLTVMAARAAEVGAVDWAAGQAVGKARSGAERARRDGYNAVVTDDTGGLAGIAAAFGRDARLDN